jgi:hypothetical protein
MELVEKGTVIKSEYEKELLILENDAYKVVGEKTSYIMYYKDGKFLSYTISD